MPEFSVVHIAIIAVMTIVGAVLGWVLRNSRAQDEKAAVSAGWQDQINAQRSEHDRLTEQNKGLMEQISQYQASNRDAKNRSKELAAAVQEAFARRDELQREIKDIRSNLEVALTEREQLKSDINARHDTDAQLKEKEQRINKLHAELENWQNRLPPLIEKFRQRNEDAERLQEDLIAAHERIAELEADDPHGQTRIEPVTDPDSLTNGRNASNEPMENDDEDNASLSDAIAASDYTIDENNDVFMDASDAVQDIDTVDAVDAEHYAADVDSEPAGMNGMNGARDELQAIKGVGPAIEKTLNEMGIFRYQQIAEMSEYDIDRVAKRLKGFRSRIYREDWIGQARDLRDQQPGD